MITLLFVTHRGLYPMAGAVGIYDVLAESIEAQVDAAGQAFSDFELIVVDKHNNLPRPEIRRIERQIRHGVRYARPRETPWTAMGAFAPNSARNTGLILARGDTVVGLDDCFSMSPRYLARIAELAAGGIYTAAILRQADGTVSYPPQTPGPFPADKFGGGLTSYPLTAACAVNGWDERFDGGSGGDIDFFDRTRRHGVTYVRDPLVVACGYGHGARTVAHPRCWRLVWDIALKRRTATLRANDPWTEEELERWRSCGRLAGRCALTRGPCDYHEPEPLAVTKVRVDLETRPWFDLTSARGAVGVCCGPGKDQE